MHRCTDAQMHMLGSDPVQKLSPHLSPWRPSNIAVFALFGTIFRILYAYFLRPWHQAPDHFAWEMSLDDVHATGHISYDQLIHYPHEGGSILISLLCLCIKLFTKFNSLAIAALLIDTATRWVQMYVVQKIFDSRISLAFGIWTIVALPSLIPWSSVNFGLHSISSFFPFLLLWILRKGKNGTRHFILQGTFLGLAIWFSHVNIVLVPVYLLFLLFQRKSMQQSAYALLSLAAILALHSIVKTQADAGFHLADFSADTIRGFTFRGLGEMDISHLNSVWGDQLPGSTLLKTKDLATNGWLQGIWITLGVIGLGMLLLSRSFRDVQQGVTTGFLIVVVFMVSYAVSPFLFDNSRPPNFVAYRHLSYILPLLSLYVIVGLSKLRLRFVLLPVYLACGVYGSCMLFAQAPRKGYPLKETGWILTSKFGHDPEKLSRIIERSEYNQDEFMIGVGWGMSTLNFSSVAPGNEELLEQKIQSIVLALDEFKPENRMKLIEGVRWSFEAVVDPKLDMAILYRLFAYLPQKDRRY